MKKLYFIQKNNNLITDKPAESGSVENKEEEKKIEKPEKTVTPEMRERNKIRGDIIRLSNELKKIGNKNAIDLNTRLVKATSNMTSYDVKAGGTDDVQKRSEYYKEAQNIFIRTVAPLIREVNEFLKNPNKTELNKTFVDNLLSNMSFPNANAIKTHLENMISKDISLPSTPILTTYKVSDNIYDAKSFQIRISNNNNQLNVEVNELIIEDFKPTSNTLETTDTNVVETSTSQPPDASFDTDNEAHTETQITPDITESQEQLPESKVLEKLVQKINQRISVAINHFNNEPFRNKTQNTLRTTLFNYLNADGFLTPKEITLLRNSNYNYSSDVNLYEPIISFTHLISKKLTITLSAGDSFLIKTTHKKESSNKKKQPNTTSKSDDTLISYGTTGDVEVDHIIGGSGGAGGGDGSGGAGNY